MSLCVQPRLWFYSDPCAESYLTTVLAQGSWNLSLGTAESTCSTSPRIPGKAVGNFLGFRSPRMCLFFCLRYLLGKQGARFSRLPLGKSRDGVEDRWALGAQVGNGACGQFDFGEPLPTTPLLIKSLAFLLVNFLSPAFPLLRPNIHYHSLKTLTPGFSCS